MGRRKSRRKAGSGGSDSPRSSKARARKFLVGFPMLVAVAAAVVYMLARSGQAAAGTAAIGALVWLAVGLGQLGSSVPPRDVVRPGAIDFGKRNPK